MEARCRDIGRRVTVIVNYESVNIDDEILEEYSNMVRRLEERYYQTVSRYTTSAFMRLKLERALTRKVAPHLFETESEAQAYLAGAATGPD